MSRKRPLRKRSTLICRSREMRKRPAPAEKELWDLIRNRKVAGFKFRRQHPIAQFIVDFYCAQLKLVIEVDGPYHDQQRSKDSDRMAYLESYGCTIIRFSNHAVLNEIENILKSIKKTCLELHQTRAISHK